MLSRLCAAPDVVVTDKQLETSVPQRKAAEEELERSMHKKTVKMQQQDKKINGLNEQFNKFKTLLEKKGFSASRQNTSTTYEMYQNLLSSCSMAMEQNNPR